MQKIDKSKDNTLSVRLNQNGALTYTGIFALQFVSELITPSVIYSIDLSTVPISYNLFILSKADLAAIQSGDYTINFFPVNEKNEDITGKTPVYSMPVSVFNSGSKIEYTTYISRDITNYTYE